MATERIQIIVNESGSRTVVRNFQDMGTAAGNAASALDLLKAGLEALALAATVRELIDLADAFTNIQNRIRIVTDSAAQLVVVQNQLFQIAQQTRQSYETTAETYSRVALAAKALGISQSDLLTFTTNLNKAIAVSGASAQVAQNGMIQLAQGLGRGVLQGQDLRAVLEDIPTVGDVIAAHFGVARGQLQQMGAEGKITAKDIIAAFTQAGTDINEKFGKTVPTISQGFQVLKNAVVQYVGTVATASGSTAALANALITIANHIDPIARSVAALAASFILLGVVIPKVVSAVNLLTAAIAANPIGALIVLLTTAISLLAFFSDEINIGAGHIASLRDVALAAWEEIKSGLASLVQFFKENFGGIYTIVSDVFSQMDLSFAGVLTFYAKYIDTLIGLFWGAYNSIIAIWKGLPAALESIIVDAVNKMLKSIEDFDNGVIAAINKITSVTGAGSLPSITLGQLGKSAAAGSSDLGKTVGDAFKSGFTYSGATDEVNKVLQRADDIARDRAIENTERLRRQAAAQQALTQHGPATFNGEAPQSTKKTFADYLKQLQDEAQLLALDARQREIVKASLDVEERLRRKLTETERAQLTAAAQQIQQLQDQNAIKDYLKNIQQEIDLTNLDVRAKAELKAQYDLENQLKRKLTDTEKALLKAKTDELLVAQDKKVLDDQAKQLENENILLQTNVQDRAARAAVLQAEVQIGRQLTPAEAQRITSLVKENEALQRQSQILQELNGPRQDLLQREQDLNTLFAQGKISVDQYAAAMKQLAVDITATDNSIGGGILNGLAQIAARSNDLGKSVGDGLVNAFDSATDALVNFAKTGKADVTAMLQDIAAAILKFAAQNLAAQLIGGFGGASGGGSGLLGWLGPLLSAGSAAFGGGAGAAGLGSALGAAAVNGFATGGSFTVGGSGGTDSKLVAFRATPGEKVAVTTPAQQQAAAVTNVKVVNVTDPRESVDAMATAAGEQVIMNHIRRNANTVKSLLGIR